ncbi:MAG TPA: ATP synthase F1 subunit gamma [Miltoncostaeaceae bacterium]|nr:ATP synthase F1 subunit gamma [Miltoncostaeaceae bacterium]
MPSQRDIKRRIDSVRGTRKITRAMELVASARLRRAQARIEALRPYAAAMRSLMAQSARQSGSLQGMPLLEEREEIGRGLVVLLTGDRGLAGAFNVNIIRRGMQVAERLRSEGAQDIAYVPLGKKGVGTLRFRGLPVEREYQGFSTDASYDDAVQVVEYLVERFTSGEADRVVIVYNAFRSVLEQRVTEEQLLPVPRRIVEDEDEEGEATFSKALALFEPDAKEFLERLLPTYLNTAVYRALLESAASEFAARRTAMRNASDNAAQLIDVYTLQMNRARQAAITQEILEVVAGADALS